MKLLLIFLISVFFISCADDLRVDIESDTSWSGYFGNKTVDGSGNKSIDIPDDRPQCATAQKETELGFLTAKMIAERKGIAAIFGDEKVEDEATTTAAYGLVTVCSKSD